MIIVKLQGGLGNQMFQYATGRNLSLTKKTNLLLDITDVGKFNDRTYDLHAFNIHEDLANRQHVEAIIGNQRSRLSRRLNKIWWSLYRLERRPVFSETQIQPYDPRILNTPHDVYLDGYWQSEKYFLENSETIRKDFSLRNPMSDPNLHFAERIGSSMSVSIHVRRGDYLSNSHTFSMHGVCSLNYYQDALRILLAQIPNPDFFVFSDDIAWCRANFSFGHSCSYIEGNSKYQHQEEVYLMSLCKHHIIANSTFSWWGAWLSSSKGITIAPAKWFRLLDADLQDLLPDSWLRV